MLLTRLHQGVSPPPATNMVAWYRKGQGITESGGAISQWDDQSGNARHLPQATGANQPALQGGGTLLFDGGSDYLGPVSFTLNQPATLYLRMRQITWTINDVFCDGGVANSGQVWQTGTTPNIALFSGASAATNSGLAVGSWGSVAAVFNGASSVLQVGTTTQTGNPGTANLGGLTLGATAGGALMSNIEVAEFIAYDVAHDATTRAAVIAYLNTL